MKRISQLFLRVRSQAAFTMIELLIVIAILGILAVAVLSAINPIEQINRGRDTGSQSDAEQLISGIERFSAFQGYMPWQVNPADTNTALAWADFDGTLTDSDGTCLISEKLASDPGSGATCTTHSDELKSTFFDRITTTDYNDLFIYNRGNKGDSTYVCFAPTSKAFEDDANERCVDQNGTGLPSDIAATIKQTICGGAGTGTGTTLYCLP